MVQICLCRNVHIICTNNLVLNMLYHFYVSRHIRPVHTKYMMVVIFLEVYFGLCLFIIFMHKIKLGTRGDLQQCWPHLVRRSMELALNHTNIILYYIYAQNQTRNPQRPSAMLAPLGQEINGTGTQPYQHHPATSAKSPAQAPHPSPKQGPPHF